MHMIMGGLHHIHTNGVVHRDLKPENCLIDNKFSLRIIDFGLSKLSSQKEFGRILLGTPHYLAPEVYIHEGRDEAYREPLDVWSAGVIMYYLLSGELPFDEPDLEVKIREADPEFYGSRWKNVSFSAKSLIRKMLDKSPLTRIKANKCLEHEFFESIRE